MRQSEHRNRTRLGRDEGQSLVEFAFVLPLFLTLLLGVLDFGKAFNYWLDESHLAAMGARWAVVDWQPPSGTLADYIKSQADSSELRDGATVSIAYPDGCDVGDPVIVSVTYEHNWLPWLIHIAGLPPTTITGEATMRLEQKPSGGC